MGAATVSARTATTPNRRMLFRSSLDPVRSVIETLAIGAVAALTRLPQTGRRGLHVVPLCSRAPVVEVLDQLARLGCPLDRMGRASLLPECLRVREPLLQNADLLFGRGHVRLLNCLAEGVERRPDSLHDLRKR